MSHLGDLTTVLADDEGGTWVDLPVEVRLRALAHVADCPGCRADVEAQRRVKARVRLAAGAPTLQAMPAGLLDSLLRLPASPQQQVPPSRPAQLVTAGNVRRGRYLAAAGIAASVVVGLGTGGSVLAGSAAGGGSPGPTGASPSPAPIGVAHTPGVGLAQVVSTRFGATADPTTRPFSSSALSVVYRRP